ncbi:hypothetical protein [Haliangium sp.]
MRPAVNSDDLCYSPDGRVTQISKASFDLVLAELGRGAAAPA